MEPWRVSQTKILFSSKTVRFESETCILPDGRTLNDYYVLRCPDWVNVLPVTTSGELIVIDQYRHTNRQIHVEIPGGSSDPGEAHLLEVAAARELLEETGYQALKMECVGAHYPNPALQSNQMVTFIGWGCTKVAEPSLDPFEDLKVRLIPLSDLESWLLRPPIHSLMLASYALARPRLESFLKSSHHNPK